MPVSTMISRHLDKLSKFETDFDGLEEYYKKSEQDISVLKNDRNLYSKTVGLMEKEVEDLEKEFCAKFTEKKTEENWMDADRLKFIDVMYSKNFVLKESQKYRDDMTRNYEDEKLLFDITFMVYKKMQAKILLDIVNPNKRVKVVVSD